MTNTLARPDLAAEVVRDVPFVEPVAEHAEHAERAVPAELPWGRRYAAVEPTHFRVDYAINPFMDTTDQPDPARTLEQWGALVAALRTAGAEVEVLAQRPDSPDMVYAMNLGLAVERPGRDGETTPQVVMSHMRYAERRHETASAAAWFAARGADLAHVGSDGVGPHLEAGDAFAYGGRLVVGHGKRTEEAALAPLAEALGVEVLGVRLVAEEMYHLDLAFCPLDERRAIVCPDALDEASAAALLDLVPEPLVISEAEAMTFCANSVVVGRTVVMPRCPDRVRDQLEAWGFEVVLVDLSELHKGGGSARCLTNPLDVRVGRDLDVVRGGRVTLP